MDVFVARQPIFDNNYNVVAYELLYRDSFKNYYDGNRADNVATSLLIANTFLTFGIKNIVSDKKAFINFDHYSIVHKVPELLRCEDVVIEILETVEPNKQFLDQIDHLNELGYTLALDDFSVDYKFENIIERVKIIKVDFFENTRDEIEALVKRLKLQGKILLAEKVETKEEYRWAKKLGFDMFQGYYFAKPDVHKGKNLDNNAIQYIKLMSELNKTEPNFKAISNILKLDIALTYRLLKLVNAIVKPLEKIRSIQQAIVLLGAIQFRRWLTLSVVQNMSRRETFELTKCALFRTHFLASIAKHSKMYNLEDELALLGTLSILDTILEITMEELINNLPLDSKIAATLLGYDTKYSIPYKICMHYERGEFDSLDTRIHMIDYDASQLQKDYLEAIKWSEDTYDLLNQFK